MSMPLAMEGPARMGLASTQGHANSGRMAPCRRLQSARLVSNIHQRLSPLMAARNSQSPSQSLPGAIPSLRHRDETLLHRHGISTIEDLETIHYDLHLASGTATRLFLQDVVGIKNEDAVRDVLEFLGADLEEANTAAEPSPRSSDAALLDSVDSSPQPQRSSSPSGSSSSRARSSSPMRTGGVSAAPTRSSPALPTRSSSRLSPQPMMQPSSQSNNNMYAAVPSASRFATGATALAPSYADDMGSLEELAKFETQVLDLLQNYSGLSLERLDGLLYMSGKEPKYTQGMQRLQLLLDAMQAQGTVRYEDNLYRFQRRTPEPRAKSPTPSMGRSSSNGSGARGSGAASPRPAMNRSPGGRAPAPRPVSETVDLSGYERRLVEVLGKYEGLPLERLNNMLSMSPGEPRYEASPEQLEVYLNSLIMQGKVIMDKSVYKWIGGYAPRAASPSGSRRPAATPPPMNPDIAFYEPACLDLLQSYAGLTLQRLDSLLSASPKAVGYRSSPRQLSQLVARLIQDGKVTEDNGLFRYRPQTPRAKSPTGARKTPLPPAPLVSRRKTSTPAPGPPPRMADIAFYEPAVIDLLQNYAGLTVERLDGLLASSPRAPGYVKSPALLQGLLTVLQSQGRIVNENGIYRYKSTGKTPTASRGKTPTSPATARPGSPTPVADAVDKVRKALSLGNLPNPAQLLRSASPPSVPVPEDWGVYENTVMTMLGNYGALPLDRLHDMLQMSMVWPRYDRTPAQLSSFLAALVSSGKLVRDNGLFRLPGSSTAARAGPYTSTPSAMARYEGQVLSTLAAYPGLTTERLMNMLKLSKTGAADVDEESLSSLMTSLVSQGKVATDNGLYKVKDASSARSSPGGTSDLSRGSSPTHLSEDQVALLDKVGFPMRDGIAGFVPFVEVWNGRWAMVGILASILVELRTGNGTLEQLGIAGLPSMELFHTIINSSLALVALGAVVSLARYATGNMDARETQRYSRLLTGKAQEVEQADKFYTDELQYVRKAEEINGRAAMIGFLFGITMEALTGRGIVGQVALYLKLIGLLGDDSGF